MRMLGLARSIEDFHAVVRAMRKHGIEILGPFRRRNGAFICSLADCVVMENETWIWRRRENLTLPAFRSSPPRSKRMGPEVPRRPGICLYGNRLAFCNSTDI